MLVSLPFWLGVGGRSFSGAEVHDLGQVCSMPFRGMAGLLYRNLIEVTTIGIYSK